VRVSVPLEELCRMPNPSMTVTLSGDRDAYRSWLTQKGVQSEVSFAAATASFGEADSLNEHLWSARNRNCLYRARSGAVQELSGTDFSDSGRRRESCQFIIWDIANGRDSCESPSSRWLVVAKIGIRSAWQSAWLRRMMFFAWVPGLVMGFMIFIYEQSAKQGGDIQDIMSSGAMALATHAKAPNIFFAASSMSDS
jgi:hypothetical protein